MQAELEAARGHGGAQLRRALLGLAVEHDLQALHEPAPAHVADDRVPVLQLAQAGLQDLALGRDAGADAVLEHVEHGVADRGDERVVDVGRVEEEVALVGAGLDLVVVTTAASASPAPSVLDIVMMSGTTPSRSKP